MPITSDTILFFRWRGNLNQKSVKGKAVSPTIDSLVQLLKSRQIRIESIEDYTPGILERRQYRIRFRDVLNFTQQITTLLNAGLPIIQALSFLTAKSNAIPMQILLCKIEFYITNGTSLAEALRKTDPLFVGIYADLIHIGELSGDLPEGFTKVLTYLEQKTALRTKIVKAAIYPCLVIMTSLLLACIMLTVVIPEFETIYRSLNAPLPELTQFIIRLSHHLRQYGLLLIVIIVVLACGGYYLIRHSSRLRQKLAALLFHLPVFGPFFLNSTLVQIMSTLATCYNAGLSLTTGLDTTRQSTRNPLFIKALDAIQNDISCGTSLYSAASATQQFPELVLQMILIGEESGTLGEIFVKITDNYQRDVDHFVDNLGKIIEPLIILLLGVIVGGLVIAMYLPIFSLMDAMG